MKCTFRIMLAYIIDRIKLVLELGMVVCGYENIKSMHFIGVGGVSMSKLAVFYSSLGIRVSGSDLADSETLHNLKSIGLNVYVGSRVEVATESDLIVYSSAISTCDVEYLAGEKRVERKELLRDFASRFGSVITVSGAHGKTTTSAIIRHILSVAGLMAYSHVGGDALGYDSLEVSNNRDILVMEGCEYKRSFLSIPSDYSIVLNVDYDHPDTYSNIDEVYDAFAEFLHGTKVGQLIEYSYYDKLSDLVFGTYRDCLDKAVTFGANAKADYSYSNVYCANGAVCFDLFIRGVYSRSFRIPSLNKVIVKSAVAAIALADILGVDINIVAKALESFRGVARRAECLGLSSGGCRVITDYAHHPSEIKELLMNIRDNVKGKLVAVFEPHTYSRTKSLINEFVDSLSIADVRFILPTYPARELPSDGINSIELTYRFREFGVCASYTDYDSLEEKLLKYDSDDLILLIGAGIKYTDIYESIR